MPLRIVVVDPNPARRAEYQRVLAGAVVHATAELKPEAAPAFDVAMLSLTQAEGHGLELGRELKKRWPAAHVVVYGRPTGGTKLGREAATAFGVDRVLPAPPDALDLVAMVDAQQRAVRVAQRDSLPPANDSTPAKGPTWGELLRAPINGATMRAIFTKNLRSA